MNYKIFLTVLALSLFSAQSLVWATDQALPPTAEPPSGQSGQVAPPDAQATADGPLITPENNVVAPPPELKAEPEEEKKPDPFTQPYMHLAYKNIARSIWALNGYALTDDIMIDSFVKVTECNLFKRFYEDEFEWRKIREATRAYLSKYKVSFPVRYEYVQPIFFDRYDFSLKGFALTDKSLYSVTTRFEIKNSLDNFEDDCNENSTAIVPGYPFNVILTTRQPFSLSFVRVNEDLAKEYIRMTHNIETERDGRPAYIRFRVYFNRFINFQHVGQEPYVNFGGAIESFAVYADKDLRFKIYEQSLD